MIGNILVVCMGNICRSPLGERFLRHLLPGKNIYSAGIIAGEHRHADSRMAALASQDQIDLSSHLSTKLTLPLINQCDLLLAMDKEQLAIISERYPQCSGKARLFGYWDSRLEIADPYNKSDEIYRFVFLQIKKSAELWANSLRAV